MNKVGIIAADSYIICGPSDMIAFFQCLKDNGVHDSVIVDRFYRRYLTLQQLDLSVNLLNGYKVWLQEEPLRIADRLTQILEESKRFYATFKDYVPVRIGIPEMPAWIDDKFRALSEYDSLEGPPFWLREYLPEHPNTILPF